MKQKYLLLLIWFILWNLWNIQIQIAKFLSKKWALGPYDFALSQVFGFGDGFFLLVRAYRTGPGVTVLILHHRKSSVSWESPVSAPTYWGKSLSFLLFARGVVSLHIISLSLRLLHSLTPSPPLLLFINPSFFFSLYFFKVIF